MDILKVGASLGTGGFGFWNGKGVDLVSHLAGWDATITEAGGAYASFRISYKGWQVSGVTTNVNADFSMHAGSRLVHTHLRFDRALPKLAIGVVKHPDTELIVSSTDVTDMAYVYVASWGKQSLDGDSLGMAVLFRRGTLDHQETTSTDYVAVVDPEGQDYDYHFLAAWAGEPGGITTKEAFVAYLERQAEELTLAPRERLQTSLSKQAKLAPITAAGALGWARRLADSELARKTLLYRRTAGTPTGAASPSSNTTSAGSCRWPTMSSIRSLPTPNTRASCSSSPARSSTHGEKSRPTMRAPIVSTR
jgi:hypothetical protein